MTSPPIPRLKRMVEQVLDDNPKFCGVEARNSDVALTVLIWQRWYGVSEKDDGIIHLRRLFDLPREDNVKRVRAVFQNVDHKYLPTDFRVLKQRQIEQQYWDEALGHKPSADEMATHARTDSEFPAGDSVRITDIAGREVARVRNPYDKKPGTGYIGDDVKKKAVMLGHHGEVKQVTVEETRHTTKMKAVYRPKSYSVTGYQQGEQYDLEVERLSVGHPIKVVAPHQAEYTDLKAFQRDWNVVG